MSYDDHDMSIVQCKYVHRFLVFALHLEQCSKFFTQKSNLFTVSGCLCTFPELAKAEIQKKGDEQMIILPFTWVA